MNISIEFQDEQPKKFCLSLTFSLEGNQQKKYSIEIPRPIIDSEKQALLKWYFEEYPSNPYEKEKATVAEKALEEYGKKLFHYLFETNKDVYTNYHQLSNDVSLDNLTLEVIGENVTFQGIYWESIWDGVFNAPLAFQGVHISRKNTRFLPYEARVPDLPFLRILLVVARPAGELDVGYGKIQRPLLQSLQSAASRVKIEVFHADNFDAFRRHLQNRGSAYYHLIHFDMHGEVFHFEQLEEKEALGKYTLEGVIPFENEKAFLLFEGKAEGVAHPIEAEKIAGILQRSRVPVVVLTACKSAQTLNENLKEVDKTKNERGLHKKEKNVSLAKIFTDAGIHWVIGMRHSLNVEAGVLFVGKLYKTLLHSATLREAFVQAKRALYANRVRPATYGQEVKLADWMLPIAFQNQEVRLSICGFKSDQAEDDFYLEMEKCQYLEAPSYGFVERDKEAWLLGRSFNTLNYKLLLTGKSGIGKSAFLRDLAWWWETTKRVKGVVYVDWRAESWNLASIIKALAANIWRGKELHLFEIKNSRIQQGRLFQVLKSQAYLLVLDNVEQKLPNDLLQFIRKIQGKSKVIFGVQNEKSPINARFFGAKVYELEGLGKLTALELAYRILKAKNCLPSSDEHKRIMFNLQLRRLLKKWEYHCATIIKQLESLEDGTVDGLEKLIS